MKFTFREAYFDSSLLLGKSREDKEVMRLISSVQELGVDYMVHAPLNEDIMTPNDDWECHDAEKYGIIFEFVEGELLYMLIDRSFILNNYVYRSCNSDLIFSFKNFYLATSKIMISQKRLPNRFCPYFVYFHDLI